MCACIVQRQKKLTIYSIHGNFCRIECYEFCQNLWICQIFPIVWTMEVYILLLWKSKSILLPIKVHKISIRCICKAPYFVYFCAFLFCMSFISILVPILACDIWAPHKCLSVSVLLVPEGYYVNLDQFISKLPEEEKFVPLGELIQSFADADETYDVYKVCVGIRGHLYMEIISVNSNKIKIRGRAY